MMMRAISGGEIQFLAVVKECHLIGQYQFEESDHHHPAPSGLCRDEYQPVCLVYKVEFLNTIGISGGEMIIHSLSSADKDIRCLATPNRAQYLPSINLGLHSKHFVNYKHTIKEASTCFGLNI